MIRVYLIIGIFFIAVHGPVKAQETIRIESKEFVNPSEERYVYQVPFVTTSYGIQSEITKKINTHINRVLMVDSWIPPLMEVMQPAEETYTKASTNQNFIWFKQIYDYEIRDKRLSITFEGTSSGKKMKGLLLFDLSTGNLIKEEINEID